jgi:predicted aspartyl protease
MHQRNSRRPVPVYVQFVQHYKQKIIETSGSLISQFLPKSIHAVTSKGFELKIMLFVLALSFNLLLATVMLRLGFDPLWLTLQRPKIQNLLRKAMDRYQSSIASSNSSNFNHLSCSIILLALSITACAPKPKIVAPSPNTPPTVAASIPAPEIPPVVPATPPIAKQNDGQLYEEAVTKADAAKAIGQSAASKDDWFLVANNLQGSVELLKSIAPTSPQYNLAAKVLPTYESQLTIARQRAASFIPKPAQNVVTTAPNQVASLPNSDTFTIPIQQKLGGVPVISVTFNDNVPVPMLLDTGASYTLLTLAVANQLQLQPTGRSEAKTANGTASFQIASIDKIKFGNGEIKNVRVAIGQKDLPYGLLGHDVYDGYDITIKESSIEFRKR